MKRQIKSVLLLFIIVFSIFTVIQIAFPDLDETIDFRIVTDVHYAMGFGDRGPHKREEAYDWLDAWIYNINNTLNPNFIIQLGDIADAENATGEKAPLETMKARIREIMDVYNNSIVPYYSVCGNHETLWWDKSESLLPLQLDDYGCSGTDFYYSFDIQSEFHFVVLDCLNYTSQDAEGYSFAIWDEQKTWFENDLNSTDLPIIVFCHVPVSGKFSGDSYNELENGQEIRDLMESYNVVAVFEAHYHNTLDESYEWIEDSIHYFGTPSFSETSTANVTNHVTIDLDAQRITVECDDGGSWDFFYDSSNIFSNGFESGDFSYWSGTDIGGSNNISVVTEQKHHGDYSAKANVTSFYTEPYALVYRDFSPYQLIYARIYVRFVNLPSSNGRKNLFLQVKDDTDARFSIGVINQSSNMDWCAWAYNGSSWFKYNFTASISVDTWYCVEAKMKTGSGNAELELYINDAKVIDQSSLTVPDYLNRIYLGVGGVTEVTADYIDCVVVAENFIGSEETPPGDISFSLTSVPSNVSFTINGISKTTPYSYNLASGTYQINFTSSFSRTGLTWSFGYWNDNYNTNPNRAITLDSDSSYSVTYFSEYAPITYTGSEAVLECAMNNMFELNGMLEGNDTHRQMIIDYSPYENHGKIYPENHPYAGPTLSWGVVGKALEFDGSDDYILVDNSKSLNISEALTVEFWFMAYNVAPQQWILSKHDNGTGAEWGLGIQNGKLITEIFTNTTQNQFKDTTSSQTIEAGIFYFFGITYDYRDGYYTVFLHGEPAYNVTTDGYKIHYDDSPLYIGVNPFNMSWAFNGVIDEIRIFPYKRDENEIYTDAREPLTKFGEYTFESSGLDGTVQEGIINSTYHGFTKEDRGLPWAHVNDTYTQSFVRLLKYTAGFQSYQTYSTVKILTNDSFLDRDENYVEWSWSFFKYGKLQATYYVRISHYILVNIGQPYLGVAEWQIKLFYKTPYSGELEVQLITVEANYTAFYNYFPLILSAWIGSDNKHFSIRVDTQDERFPITVYNGDLPFIYSFPLIDSDGDIHITDWFDGHVMQKLKARAEQNTAGKYATISIDSHKWIGIVIGIIVGLLIGTAISYVISPDVRLVINTIAKEIINILEKVSETVGTAVKKIGDVVADALAGIAHDLSAGLTGLGNVFSQALRPITEALWKIGESFASGILSFMIPIVTAVSNAVNALSTTIVSGFNAVLYAIFRQENLFTNFVLALQTAVLNIGQYILWMIEGTWMSGSLLGSIFILFGATMGKYTSVVGQIVIQWVLVIQGVIAFLDGTYTSGINVWNDLNMTMWLTLFAILYPLWLVILWEEKGLDAVVNHITFVGNVTYWILHIIIVIAQNVVAFIDYLVESVPIVE